MGINVCKRAREMKEMREENLLLERFHINKKQQTRKESSIELFAANVYHNRISFR